MRLFEYFIGHSVSTYWRKKESEKADIFRKIEPYLTFLNIHQLERQGGHHEQGERVGGGEPIPKRKGQKQG